MKNMPRLPGIPYLLRSGSNPFQDLNNKHRLAMLEELTKLLTKTTHLTSQKESYMLPESVLIPE
jgi:hypothetical protein